MLRFHVTKFYKIQLGNFLAKMDTQFNQVIIDNIKQEPELIIEENDDLEPTKEQCDHEEINQLTIDDKVLCSYCNKFFSNLQILKTHQKFHHNGNYYFTINIKNNADFFVELYVSDFVYNCHLCSFKTKYYSNLHKHTDSVRYLLNIGRDMHH